MKVDLELRGNELINSALTLRITGHMVVNIINTLTFKVFSMMPGIGW